MWTSSLSRRFLGSMAARYALAVVSVAAALLVVGALHLRPVNPLPYLVLFPVVALCALYCGIGPSVLAIGLAAVGLRYWFMPPIHSLRFPNMALLIDVVVFVITAGMIVAMGEIHRRHNEALRNVQGELERRVQERTLELARVNESLRELSSRLLRSQDEERRRIARELHDSVGQILAALSMNLSAARAEIERLTKAAATLTDSENLVREMSTEVRTLSHLLHPPLLDEAGLPSALRWYVDGFAQRSKIKVDLDMPADFGRLSQELETAIFRVVQECLTNIHRHSGSPVAKIRLRHRDGEAFVEVEDKGKGMPPEKRDEISSTGPVGVGIRGMRERLRQLGGTLDIRSSGNGTVVVGQLPEKRTPPLPETLSLPENSPAPSPDSSSSAAA
jgi:signal transduction histidine kinase